MYVNKQKQKVLTIIKNKTRKIKRYLYIKIFNLAKQNIYLIVFTEFIYQN